MKKMNETEFLREFQDLLAIDSTTGQFRKIHDYMVNKIKSLGYECIETRKGGVLACLGGEGEPLVITAHLDDIGLMVRHIKKDGSLMVCPVGGLHAESALHENIRLHTRDGKVITGAVQRDRASVHVTPDKYFEIAPNYEENVVVILDEDVKSDKDTEALGVQVGDMIALEPRYMYSNGYIKARFIDDKAQVAILIELMKALKNEGLKLNRKVYMYFAAYEEIGHGTSWLPEDAADVLGVDIACVGPEQTTDERKVSIFCKDSRFPYHYEFNNELIEAAKKAGANYVLDIFTPHYGSDGDTSIVAGHDIRHACVGPGTRATHGYERSHIDGMNNTYALILAYITE